jgi:hypothetical protein
MSMSQEMASARPAAGAISAQSSPMPSTARPVGRVKKRSMSSNSPRVAMLAADYRRLADARVTSGNIGGAQRGNSAMIRERLAPRVTNEPRAGLL